jgi:competence protein ComEC
MKNPTLRILAVLVFLNILAWLAFWDFSRTEALTVIFFDVGQGDSIFIKTSQNQQILIDGGPNALVLERLGEVLPFWDRTLDLIILTHPDHDHIAGLIEVLKSYKVENILWTGVAGESAEYLEWQKLVKEEGAQVRIARAGQRIVSADFVLTILYPQESLLGKKITNTNNSSVVSRLVCGERSFLFTGDIYQSVESELLKSGQEIDSDVLKISHHGSKTSSSQEFLSAVSPALAVISAGADNPYGHPASEILARLEKYGINIFRTDLNNNITIICNSQFLKPRVQRQ